MKYPRHLLQSSNWTRFKQKWGTRVVNVGKAHFTVHPIPFLPWTIGYLPRPFAEDINWQELIKKAKEERCVFIKLEPNSEIFKPPAFLNVKVGERMFSYATYLIDLQKSEQELLANMQPKTRYNIKLAAKKSVKVKVGHSQKMLEEFLSLYHQTANRQKFFIHPDEYFKTLFDIFQQDKQAEIITGYYQEKPLASIMVLIYNKTLFYPYGGSTNKHKELMPFYLVMWQAILLGKKQGCRFFDLWNCLLPEMENPTHPWYGFHRFKKGFNGQLIRFCGAYDIVFNPFLYPLLLLFNKIRWIILKIGKALE